MEISEDEFTLDKIELKAVSEALRLTNNNQTQAAKLLNISRSKLIRLKKRLEEERKRSV